jgi:5-methylcytosine-specific restriction endonuclease McrA
LAHPDKVRADKRGRKLAKRARTLEILTKAQRGRCAICRCRLGDEVHIDHIMPKALGGSNRRSNLQLTCAPCNLAKGPRHPLDHARSLGLLL